MTHRRRGLLFAAASIGAALIAASAVARHERSVDPGGSALRPVLIARAPLDPGHRLRAGDIEVRRFPAGFVPPEVAAGPAQVVGEKLAVGLPAGAYLLPGFIDRRRQRDAGATQATPVLRGTPVEVGVVGAEALRRTGAVDGRVDVLVTRDSRRGLGGRTRVAVPAAHLIALDPDRGEPGESRATLAVRRAHALRLIEAESYAREIRLIAARR